MKIDKNTHPDWTYHPVWGWMKVPKLPPVKKVFQEELEPKIKKRKKKPFVVKVSGG